MDSYARQMRAGREPARPETVSCLVTLGELGVPGKLLVPVGTLIFDGSYRWPLAIVEVDTGQFC